MQSFRMWPSLHPANSAASTVVTMSSMSSLPAIVATPHLRRQSLSRLRTISLRPMYQRRGRDCTSVQHWPSVQYNRPCTIGRRRKRKVGRGAY